MEIDKIKCSACGCTGIHACLGERTTELTSDDHKQDLSNSGNLLSELIAIADNSPRISLKGRTVEDKKEELLQIFKGE